MFLLSAPMLQPLRPGDKSFGYLYGESKYE